MPPELLRSSSVDLPLVRRDPHYFLPTTGQPLSALRLRPGGDEAAVHSSSSRDADWRANEAMQAEIGALRDDIAPTWLEEPLSIEETAERYVRPALRAGRSSICAAARSATTSSASASRATSSRRCTRSPTASPGCTAPGTRPAPGMNFLVHNMCRLPGSRRHLDDRRGRHGHGHAARSPRPRARPARASRPDAAVERIVHRRRRARAACVLEDGSEVVRADVVVSTPIRSACATWSARDALARRVQRRLDGYRSATAPPSRSTWRSSGLPQFTCLPEDRGQFGADHPPPARREGRHALARRRLRRRCRPGELARVPDHRVVHPHHGRSDAAATRTATTTRRSSCSGCPTSSRGSTLGGRGGRAT